MLAAGGTHKDATLTVMTDVSECVVCPEGTFCSVGSAEATDCAPGTYNDKTEQETCKNCDPGTFQAVAGQTVCDARGRALSRSFW